MYKYFFGISLPDNIKRQLAAISCGIRGANWVREENFYLTLHSLGALNPEKVFDVKNAMEQIKFPVFEITSGGIDLYVKTLRVKAIVTPPLSKLKKNIVEALSEIGLPNEKGPFLPHITICRLESEKEAHRNNYLADHLTWQLDPFSAKELALFCSHSTEKRFVQEMIFSIEFFS